MATPGYSGTPLLRKLGILPTTRLHLVNAPANYFQLLGSDVPGQLAGPEEAPDMVHLFAQNRQQFELAMKHLAMNLRKNRNLVVWVSWYKKSAGIPTDLTEDVIRSYALKNGLVDVKVCAVSDSWSGLKLVVPVKLR